MAITAMMISSQLSFGMTREATTQAAIEKYKTAATQEFIQTLQQQGVTQIDIDIDIMIKAFKASFEVFTEEYERRLCGVVWRSDTNKRAQQAAIKAHLKVMVDRATMNADMVAMNAAMEK